jgi:hypothetical protein
MKSIIIIEARCESCDQIWSNSRSGRYTPHPERAGKQHARRHGHTVRVTTTVVRRYGNGNGKEKATK